MRIVIASLLALTGIALCQSSPREPSHVETTPGVDRLIQRNIDALGGRDALSNIGPLKLTGYCDASVSEESGPVEIVIKSPRVYYRLGEEAELQMGFNGQVFWRNALMEGLQRYPSREMAELVTVFDPGRVLHWKEWYPEMKVVGAKKVEGEDAYFLEAASHTHEHIAISRKSGLILTDEVMPKLVFHFSDYRSVDGVMIPFTVIETAPNGLVYTYHFKNAEHVSDVEDWRFQPK